MASGLMVPSGRSRCIMTAAPPAGVAQSAEHLHGKEGGQGFESPPAPAMTVAIGLDIGTTGAQAIAVDDEGRVVGTGSSDYPLLTPRPQWADRTRGVVAGRSGGVQRRGGEGRRARRGRIGSRPHGPDARVRVPRRLRRGDLRPALLWNDQRTARQCEAITELVGERRLVEITGNPALTGFQAPKVLCPRGAGRLRAGRPRVATEGLRAIGSGELATDASDAAGTLFLDLRERDWSGEVLEALGIPAAWCSQPFARARTWPSPPPGRACSGSPRASRSRRAGATTRRPRHGARPRGADVELDGRASCSRTPTRRRSTPRASTRSVTRSRAGTACSRSRSRRGFAAVVQDATGAGYDELVAEAESVPAGRRGSCSSCT